MQASDLQLTRLSGVMHAALSSMHSGKTYHCRTSSGCMESAQPRSTVKVCASSPDAIGHNFVDVAAMHGFDSPLCSSPDCAAKGEVGRCENVGVSA